ncbi:MAG: hypothetical protein Q9160_001285 [Pyrenula sp. 1 TL-2023]
MANGYGVGLACAWGIVWSATLLVFNDHGRAFQRIEQRQNRDAKAQPESQNGSATGPRVFEEKSVQSSTVINSKAEQKQDHEAEAEAAEYSLIWQHFPGRFFHRLDWTLDLCTSFRGPGWNWRIPSLPRLPKMDSSEAPPLSSPSSASASLKPLLKYKLFEFLFLYLLVDTFETLFHHDPYFWNPDNYPLHSASPPAFPRILHASPVLRKSYRLFFSMSATALALEYVFVLNPLVYGGLIAHLLPSLSNLTRAPLSEPFLYPPQWGPPSAILDHGLPGFWGKWWHQMFRHGISEPGRFLTSEVLHLPLKSTSSRVIQVMMAFSLSGFLHASASYTQFADTKPLHPFLFFFLQGIGVLAQGAIALKLKPLTEKLPKWARRAGNAAVVALWAYYTGPLLANDFARGGVWLFEGIPVSIWRGLMGEGWWCWHGKWFMWWDKGRWWERGFAIV